MRAQRPIDPCLEDWVYHALLPMVAYGNARGLGLRGFIAYA